MPPSRPEAPGLRPLAAAGLACVLAVVLASAAIRLNGRLPFLGATQVSALRLLHRVSASLEVLVALWIGGKAWRSRQECPARAIATGLLLALTVALSVIGIAGGRDPSPPMALGNVLGGLALAFAFAWLCGSAASGTPAITGWLAALLALQAFVGARLSIFGHGGAAALPLHIYLGLGLALLAGWVSFLRGQLLFALALLAPLAGFTALQYEYSGAAALAHAASAAFLVAALACAARRNA
jgi:hypothetical protein